MKKILIVFAVLSVLLVACKIQISSDEESVYNSYIKSDDIKFEVDGSMKTFAKTGFVTVIPKNRKAVIPEGNCVVTDWDNYENDRLSDVFLSTRKITLNSFEMCKYEVTQELYEAVMGKNPYPDAENKYGNEIQRLRPVAGVCWNEAVIFCNELSRKCGLEEVYTISNIKKYQKGKPNEYVYSATVSWDLNKNGYRLPTEAEWEYAARGAGKTAADWKYRFAGSDNSKQVAWTVLTSSGYSDDDDTERTHEVGLKKPNALGIYDMSGNVSEWCMDWYRSVTEKDDYKHGNAVPVTSSPSEEEDPILKKGNYDNHTLRGGSYNDTAGKASLWQRLGEPSYVGYASSEKTYEGIRLVRRR